MKRLIIIGAGAAGMFCAAQLCREKNLDITILEAADSPLQKLLLTGGGRCNFTNTNIDGGNPKDFYPRGARYLRKPLRAFGCNAVREFFAALGAPSKVEELGRVFPVTNDAHTIAAVLEKSAAKSKLLLGAKCKEIVKNPDGTWRVNFSRRGKSELLDADAVLFASGGTWSKSIKESLAQYGAKFASPVASLFSINTDTSKSEAWRDLSGVAKPDTIVEAIVGSEKFCVRGALLIAHFGLGGPAILNLSAFGARAFSACGYNFKISVNWIPEICEENFRQEILRIRNFAPKKTAHSTPLFGLTRSFWEYVCQAIKISQRQWSQFSKDDEIALKKFLHSDEIQCIGKSAHKGEFVTCGGLECECLNFSSCSLKGEPNLFFAGECLDIDGITGGFNLQAAWTTAKLAADSIKKIH